MFEQITALKAMLELAQDEEKRSALIAEVMAPVNRLAMATAQLAREVQAMRGELAQTDETVTYLHLLLIRVHADEVRKIATENTTVTNEESTHGN